ncbi:ABC transporter permease protein (plasmid) [Rhizobium etli 8C-3]|uniref:Carbohydrate ABC transporter membrane protein 1 (CUT1 family) n=2 Tax=Rhizobium TaxID=379 RepID=A0A4R3R7A5_9HYPH|nr:MULTISPECIES: sugar ABC transporter permease [Rhizobium]APO78127.1 ABC transporter permease protein [Rhizobium etli 8C-3]TCU31083.1 carbohydrate ABC transporter membrane protein 1 (CUT1 family) [Rhizobium azibense]TCU40894.1 carbohydrate ABC transporter membrane protein 1 (CUT1 family) [Rhizobium azibense]
MSSVSIEAAKATATRARSKSSGLAPNYWPFVVPALIVIAAVIVFPWVFTLWMSVNSWTLGQAQAFSGWDNYLRLATDTRFWDSLWHTILYTALAVIGPLFLGTLAALIFDAQFPLRGFLRGIFVMPMMATPVAIALVWTMMFHPQLGVLNYILSLVGIGPQEWIYNQKSVIPSLVLVETWQWTPLIMLIVLGGLAALPREPYESAEIDGANAWQKFRYLTLPMIAPFLMVGVIIRSIDAVKSFDIIYAMTQGGPGTASETINIYLYNTAFAYYDIGYGSAMAVVFFVVIVALSFVLMMVRARTNWSDTETR